MQGLTVKAKLLALVVPDTGLYRILQICSIQLDTVLFTFISMLWYDSIMFVLYVSPYDTDLVLILDSC